MERPMSTVEESIDVEVPVRTAYNQWTQFEEFPQFMEGVEEIRQIDDTPPALEDQDRRRRRASSTPRSPSSTPTSGSPGARPTVPSTPAWSPSTASTTTRTRVMVQLDTEPEGIVEKAGDKLGILKRRVKGDLERFKEFIEERGTETGAWRGDVEQPPTA